MRKKILARICTAICLAQMTGCTGGAPSAQTETLQQTESETHAAKTESVSADAAEESPDGPETITGQGFTPPKGSRVDRNGNYVDKEGNTYAKDGGWAVPEGGHIDSQGRIIDKNGNVMGGATVGSKG